MAHSYMHFTGTKGGKRKRRGKVLKSNVEYLDISTLINMPKKLTIFRGRSVLQMIEEAQSMQEIELIESKLILFHNAKPKTVKRWLRALKNRNFNLVNIVDVSA